MAKASHERQCCPLLIYAHHATKKCVGMCTGRVKGMYGTTAYDVFLREE